MPHSAKVTSFEALDAFKASLIVYLERAARLLDEVGEDVVRTRGWLETDRLLHWKNRLRQRTGEMAQADQELLTARLSGLPEAIRARRMAANKAQLALRDAESGLARVKQWIRQYETQVQSHARLVMQLRQSLSQDMTKAVAFLEAAASSLAAYAEISPPTSASPERNPHSRSDREHESQGRSSPASPSPAGEGRGEGKPCSEPIPRLEGSVGKASGEQGEITDCQSPITDHQDGGAA